ncbi:MAG: lysostaphin resistance A-like protein [Acidobacteriota bacterium]
MSADAPGSAGSRLERFDRRDWRFVLACLAILAVGAGTTAALFRRAFPEASIEFRVNRNEARARGERFLTAHGRSVAGTRFAARFGVDEEPKVYLERELGLEKASKLYGREARIWHWDLRWFRSGVKEEERVSISPTGDLVSWSSVRREESPGRSLARADARALASRFLAERGLAAGRLREVEAVPVARPKRGDWTFVDEVEGLRMAGATRRYRTQISGDEVTGFEEFVHVPEAWQRDYRTLRSKNEAAGQAATFALILTFLAMLGVLITRISRRDVRWGLVGAFGIVGFLLALLNTLNNIPMSIYEYETSSPLSSHLTKEIVLGVFGAIAIGALIACIVAAAEPLYRERFPRQLSFSAIFSGRALISKSFFRSVLLGYALVAFFTGYQAVFYVVAERFGAWSPAEVPYSDMLSTAFPWATVLLIGFLPAISEEGISRMFSISFLDRLGAGRFLAVVIPAFIWGFGHSTYPNQPFYIRGLEVGFVGVVMGFVMLRFGVLPLLVWHFTVDALYTALLMLRSHDAYYVISGGIASGILLVPLVASAVLAARRGGFTSDAGLTNADIGSAPEPPPPPLTAEPVPPVRRVSARTFALAGIAAVLLGGSFFFPSGSAARVEDGIGRARAETIARRFLETNGIASGRFHTVSYGGTGFAEDTDVRGSEPAESGRIDGFSDAAARYVVRRSGVAAFERLGRTTLPLNFWVVRFFEPMRKEEWKVFVDPRRARVIGFLNPKEEAATGGPAPDDSRARARATGTAAALGYPAGDYRVLEVGTRARPRRVDTTVVLESRSGVAEAAPRLTAVFQGSRLSAFYPSIHVPESFLERDRRKTSIDWLLLGLRIVASGAFVGFGIVVFLRAARRSDFRWRGLLRPLVPAALLAAAAIANAYPTVFRQYRTELPLATFRFTALMSLLIGWLGVLCVAAIGFVLFSAARPAWQRALRSQGGLGDALLRAGIAAAGLAGLSRWTRIVGRAVPALFDPDPSLPSAMERAIPSLAVLWSAATLTFLAAAVAAVVARGFREALLRRADVRALVLIGAVVALLPGSARSAVELAGGLAGSLLMAGWLAISAFALLRDHAAAWVFFGALAFGGSAASRLLAQPAAADRAAGWVGIALLAAAALALVGARRRQPAAAEEKPAPAEIPA